MRKIDPYLLTPHCACRSCGDLIRFEQTADGRGVPLDVVPVAGGAVDLVRDGPGRRHLESVKPEPGVVRWQVHHCEAEEEDLRRKYAEQNKRDRECFQRAQERRARGRIGGW